MTRLRLVSIVASAAVVFSAAIGSAEAQNPANPPKSTEALPLPRNAEAPGNAVRPEPGYLGVVADDMKDGTRGVRVLDVIGGSPAQTAGLRVGDVITSVNGQTVDSIAALGTIMLPFLPNDEVTFIVRRGTAVDRIDIVLGTRPPPDQRRFNNFGRIGDPTQPGAPNVAATPIPGAGASPPPNVLRPNSPQGATPVPAPGLVPPQADTAAPRNAPAKPAPGSPLTAAAPTPQANPSAAVVGPGASASPQPSLLGIRAVPVSPQMQQDLNLPEAGGAYVIDVVPGSPAQQGGLPLEAVIVGIDDKAITTPQQLADIVRQLGSGTDVTFSFYRYGQLQQKKLRLGGPNAATNVRSSVAASSSAGAAATTPANTKPAAPIATPATPAKLLPTTGLDTASENAILRDRVRELEARLAELEAKQQKGAKPAKP
jgi:membrane-associated protease RseP (regulator of RpoE activity)